MTTAKHPLYQPIAIPEFTTSHQSGFFEDLKQSRFSGQVVFTGQKQEKWYFFLYLGRIIYATGGIHPVRRWRRHLALHLPSIFSDLPSLERELENQRIYDQDVPLCWEYQILCTWVEQDKITREQAAGVIREIIVEVIFDTTQAGEITYQLKRQHFSSNHLVLIDARQAVAKAQEQWQAWQKGRIADRSPNKAPLLRQSQQLEQRTSSETYNNLRQLLDGKQTLRDLAVRMNRSVLQITGSLLPYLQTGLVELITVPDLPLPTCVISIPENLMLPSAPSGPLIACVDDSLLMCHTLGKILTAANYKFLGIDDPLRALAILIACKPALIFLDLVMPNTNGCEICSQLRRLSFFSHTPIIVLTGHDGVINRARAKIAGSSDFLSKPVNGELVLNTIRKHLRQSS